MPGQSSTTFSSISKTSNKPVTGETRDSSSTYSYDPKKDRTQGKKDKDDETKRLIDSKFPLMIYDQLCTLKLNS
ncbi:hypothetical protein RRF57_008560 [Xylaria bambusicola]|uniref:Uncharacterized protein n=1 Tax=Xylaria bambusicola TaxID=326684 RepID=A0AAN7UVI5_9PEZI